MSLRAYLIACYMRCTGCGRPRFPVFVHVKHADGSTRSAESLLRCGGGCAQ